MIRTYMHTAQRKTAICGQLIIISDTCHVFTVIVARVISRFETFSNTALFPRYFSKSGILKHVIGYFSSTSPHDAININAYGNEVSGAGTLIHI